jgi:lysophospholipase L1-like esterase
MSVDLDAQGLALQARGIAAAASAALAERASANLSPLNMAAWNRAKARVRAGVADAVIAFVGDSTTVGHGAGDDPVANFVNARFRSMPARVAAQLTAQGLPALQEAVFGGNTIDAAGATLAKSTGYNPQLTIASSGTTKWYYANEYSLGGRMLRGAGGSADLWSLTPSTAFDTIDLWYVGGNVTTTFTVDIGGAALQTITAGSNGNLTKVTVSTGAAPATGTINVRNTGSAFFRLIGVLPRSSATRRVQALNLGWEGAQAGDWASSATAGYLPTTAYSYAPDKALATLAPDLTVIKLGANDLAAQKPVATAQANLQIVIAAAKAGGGSCMLVTPTPQNPATRDPAGLTIAYNAMLQQLAMSQGCGLIDLYTRYIDWPTANGGGYFADDVHSRPLGYANEGDVIARALFGS